MLKGILTGGECKRTLELNKIHSAQIRSAAHCGRWQKVHQNAAKSLLNPSTSTEEDDAPEKALADQMRGSLLLQRGAHQNAAKSAPISAQTLVKYNRVDRKGAWR
jgi:hypothetical protein